MSKYNKNCSTENTFDPGPSLSKMELKDETKKMNSVIHQMDLLSLGNIKSSNNYSHCSSRANTLNLQSSKEMKPESINGRWKKIEMRGVNGQYSATIHNLTKNHYIFKKNPSQIKVPNSQDGFKNVQCDKEMKQKNYNRSLEKKQMKDNDAIDSTIVKNPSKHDTRFNYNPSHKWRNNSKDTFKGINSSSSNGKSKQNSFDTNDSKKFDNASNDHGKCNINTRQRREPNFKYDFKSTDCRRTINGKKKQFCRDTNVSSPVHTCTSKRIEKTIDTMQSKTHNFKDCIKSTDGKTIFERSDISSNNLRSDRFGNKGKNIPYQLNKRPSGQGRIGKQNRNSYNACNLLKLLDTVLKNKELGLDYEIKQFFLNFQSSSQDKEYLLALLGTVNKICISESSVKELVLRSMCHKEFLKVLQTFILQNTKDMIKTEEGKEVYQCFYQNIVQISRSALPIISATELSHLNHALILISAILDRNVESINFQKQLSDMKEVIMLLNNKVKQLKLEKEEISLNEISEMRHMSILPTKSDLFGNAPELKKNIVEGAYRSVDHYLTVQFMLLREDFIAPLREGIAEHLAYLKNGPFRKKSNVYVYQHVHILCASISTGRLGHVVKLETKINFAVVANQFIFGSLLLFSADSFLSFFVGTVIEVNSKNHTVVVQLNEMHNSICENLYAHEYEMAISKVFYEPYFHVLTALQNMGVDDFPMEKYIIQVDPNPKPPQYIKELNLTTYNIFKEVKVNIFDSVWPHFSSVKLNSSQHEAFQAALTKEFVAIQGPPGTGKTFLGLQIVTTLLDNVQTGTPILVVCFKNHALDQFLEGIMKRTTNIIRIGGRSQNTNLDIFNIKAHRKRYGFRDFEENLRVLATKYFTMQEYIDGLKKHGIVAMEHLLKYIPCSKLKNELLNGVMDDWLTEGIYMDKETDYLEVVDDSSCLLKEKKVLLESETYNQEHIIDQFEPKNGSFPLESLEEATRYLKLMCIDTPETCREYENKGHDGALESYTNYISTNDTYYECFEEVSDHFQSVDSEVNDETVSTKSDQQNSKQDFFHSQTEERLEQIFVDDFSNIYTNVENNIRGANANIFSKSATAEERSSLYSKPTFSSTIRNYKEYSAYYEYLINELKGTELNEEVLWMINSYEGSIQYCKKMIYFLNKMIPSNFRVSTERASKLYELADQFSIWILTTQQRWSLYHFWIDCLVKDMKKEMIQIEEAIRREEADLELARNSADLTVLQNADIVGLTTTGAAKLRPMLCKLGAKIVVIEEAAEVLESHVVAALSSQCQHAILIGDHKQLRPNPAVYELCRKFNFDISLFERMVKNGLNCYQLDVQHRMRPEISSLIVPSIYSRLMNHSSVQHRPNILGVNGNLYFINHNEPECRLIESVSHQNKFEAEYAVNLATYLIKQGYTSNEITILTTYKAQTRLIAKKSNIPSGIKVSTVDDFQGEENKIIILSLVRSNEEDSIGFLKTENRVCVALSRARDGFYIIGNMSILSRNSELWAEIKKTLIQQDAFGNSLSLCCQNHPDTVNQATGPEEFLGFPEGGCQKMCKTKLMCGHNCKYYCHPRDQVHRELYKCTHPCERMCQRNHPCPDICSDVCKPCRVSVEYKLQCGHITKVPCSTDTDHLKCVELIKCVLDCGHEAIRLCREGNTTLIKCREPCGKTLNCGHLCKETCHAQEERKCSIVCNDIIEILLECGHKSTTSCYLAEVHLKDTTCEEEVEKTLPCGHTHKVKCVEYKTLNNCSFLVKKTFECGHQQVVACNMPGETASCTRKSKRMLLCGHELEALCKTPLASLECQEKCANVAACGHPCTQLCSTPCKCNVVLKAELSCGHINKYLCGSAPPKVCDKKCTRVMTCGHPCQAKCYELCNVTKCQAITKSTILPACGHDPVDAPCYLNRTVFALDLASHCNADCEMSLECGHKCPGKCGECSQALHHKECNKPCDKILPCGHKCTQQCKELCSPCSLNCLYHCSHKKCNGICGEYCSPCKEMCTSQCIHSRCTRPCSSYCTRNPCDLPCPARLPCGHPCLGFCGEVCPKVCLECMPQFAATSKASNPRFIVLEDCGHIMVAKEIDLLFKNNYSHIVKCPLKSCQEPIVGTARYRNNIRKIFTNISKNKRQMQSNIAMAGQINVSSSTWGRGNSQYQQKSSLNQDRNRTQQIRDYSQLCLGGYSQHQVGDSSQKQMRGYSQRHTRGYSHQVGDSSQQQMRGYSQHHMRGYSHQVGGYSQRQIRGFSQNKRKFHGNRDLASGGDRFHVNRDLASGGDRFHGNRDLASGGNNDAY